MRNIFLFISFLSLCGGLICGGYYGFKAFRNFSQERFAEAHAMLADEEIDDSGMDDEKFEKLDSEVNPLQVAAGSISWKMLSQAKLVPVPNSPEHMLKAVFTPEIQKFDHKNVVAQGFMFPLDSNAKQSHFFLSPYPVSCPYCLPAGPSELIEVFSEEPVKFGYDPVTLKGDFKLLAGAEQVKDGMFYQMVNVRAVN